MKQEAQEEKIDYSKTPNYDKVCQNVRKLLSATCQTFVPEACDALRRDWFPGVSDHGMRENIKSQNMIRQRIYEDWSRESNGEGLWKESTINIFFPGWMRSPARQADAASRLEKVREAALLKKISISDEQKRALSRQAERLPENVIISEPVEEQPKVIGTKPYERAMEEEEIRKRDIETPYHNYGIINKAADFMWMSLTGYGLHGRVHDDDDIMLDHVKPTRDFRRRIAEGIAKDERAQQHNWIYWLTLLMKDYLDDLDKADKTGYDR